MAKFEISFYPWSPDMRLITQLPVCQVPASRISGTPQFLHAASGFAEHNTVAQQISMNFLSSSRGTRLTAEAVCRKDGRTSCVYQINVRDDLDRDVAQAVVTGFTL